VAIAAQKGNALEAAVAAIERQILATTPALREKTFVIESKKIICVGGVRHGVDIFVTIDLGRGYKSIFIFECKNWKKSVGKNEIVVFSEKIDMARAQHGYFIAKSFTRDAKAQAKKDARMTLLLATEHDPASVPVPFHFHFVNTVIENVAVHCETQHNSGAKSVPIDIDAVDAVLDSAKVNLRELILKWSQDACNESVNKFRSEDVPEGAYDRVADLTLNFLERQFLVDGTVMASATVSVNFKVHVFRPPVISSFEVESRGRSLAFGPISTPQGTTLQYRIVMGPSV